MAKRQAKPNKKALPGRLRIVAGKWRSRLLQIAAVPGLRPTSERVRETLFNWLVPRLGGARCLDLFAGTGALGLEALSRGAASVVFVDNSLAAISALRHNAESLQADAAKIVKADASTFLMQTSHGPFDIVFMDPPYALDALGEYCRLLADSGFLRDGALLYLEDDRGREWPEMPAGWSVDKEGKAGNVRYALVSTSS
ncbi:MAG: 16S rRNA (guanine(966)-N(2))-methyltransferase RsmD [Woeseiaceae bacterium]